MDQLATEVLEPKLWLTKSRCDSLHEAQVQLIAHIDALEMRLQTIRSSVEPLQGYRQIAEKLQLLRKKLTQINESLEKSQARLDQAMLAGV